MDENEQQEDKLVRWTRMVVEETVRKTFAAIYGYNVSSRRVWQESEAQVKHWLDCLDPDNFLEMWLEERNA